MLASPLPEPVGGSHSVAVEATQDGAAWDDFLDQHPAATVDHLWGWRAIFQNVFRHQTSYLMARRNGQCLGALPLVLMKSRLFGRCAVSLPMLNYGGVLATAPEAISPLLEHAANVARDFRARYLELRHCTRLTSLPAKQHKASMRLPLPRSADALWAALDRKVRNQIRKAQKSGMRVESGGAALVPPFYRVFSENMRDLGTPVYPIELFTTAFEVFPDRAKAFVVRTEDGEPVAAAIALAFRDQVLVPWASARRAARQLCPNMLLYWNMLEWSVASRYRIFDFGRSTIGGGTYEFKRQWGAVPEPQCWEYGLLAGGTLPQHGPESSRFQTAVGIWKRLPLCVANAAGPLIVRNIP